MTILYMENYKNFDVRYQAAVKLKDILCLWQEDLIVSICHFIPTWPIDLCNINQKHRKLLCEYWQTNLKVLHGKAETGVDNFVMKKKNDVTLALPDSRLSIIKLH